MVGLLATRVEQHQPRRHRSGVAAAGQRRFDPLAGDYVEVPVFVEVPCVSRALMFGSQGRPVHSKFFAFVGCDGQLVIKVPAHRAEGSVAVGKATAIRAGRSITREWIGTPDGPDTATSGQ